MSSIVIYGRGKTGKSVANLLSLQGKRFVFYDDTSQYDLNKVFLPGSVVITSPGVSPCAKGLFFAKNLGCKIISELDFCWQLCKAPIISVTGTNGKTTTCQMIYHIFDKVGKKSWLLGNGGVPFSQRVLDVTTDDVVVLESSSFQLDSCKSFCPQVSLLTNVDCDHLNYHKTQRNYVYAKSKNSKLQGNGQYAVFNLDDVQSRQIADDCHCAKIFFSICKPCYCFFDKQTSTVFCNGKSEVVPFFAKMPKHDVSNALGAICACTLFGISLNSCILALSSYVSLPHRLQIVDCFDNVTFVNDSKATNVHATVSALSNFKRENLALIVGGSDKNETFDKLFCNMKNNVKIVVAVGQTARRLYFCAQKYGVNVVVVDNLINAVKLCYKTMSSCGGVVLMSNACASFDHYDSYQQRGNDFVNVVGEIKSAKKKI